VQGTNAPGTSAASILHSNVAPASSAPNVNVGVVSLVRFGGPASPVIAGPVTSTVKARAAGVGSTLPAASRARTAKVCGPSGTLGAYGEVQALNAPPSIAHSNVPGSLDVNVKGGPPSSSVVSGGVVSAAVTGVP
jgi:hypothetical protein